MKNSTSINKFVEKLVSRLKQEGFLIQYYHSMTSESVYLKLDYGVANSIRISDHKGNPKLCYRYNFQQNMTQKSIIEYEGSNGLPRYFASFDNMDAMVMLIVRHRHLKRRKLGVKKYNKAIEIAYAQNEGRPGFWQKYKYV